ncbi:hypothetical protein MNBD_GAMMA16-63 [hydrothermal vent metagenome]|uniref:Uncharacterized protein n=1 Tax=hydrothermal vent metagenome TaxID=652676 RepID=A0A3B0YY44_9ZZZZ
MSISIKSAFLSFIVVVIFALSPTLSAQETQENRVLDSDHSVVGVFADVLKEPGEAVKIEDKQKHQILFIMGVLLFVLILATATLGVRMALFGKQLFIPHMICAGATVFLSLAHAVTAIVWFYPY